MVATYPSEDVERLKDKGQWTLRYWPQYQARIRTGGGTTLAFDRETNTWMDIGSGRLERLMSPAVAGTIGATLGSVVGGALLPGAGVALGRAVGGALGSALAAQ